MTTAEAFRGALRRILNVGTGSRRLAESTENKKFRSYVGVSFAVLADIWNRMKPSITISPYARIDHLLWAFMFLKLYNSAIVLSTMVHVSEDTYRKWVWLMLEGVEKLESSVVRSRMVDDPCQLSFLHSVSKIVFENRFRNAFPGQQSFITVDCTDCRIYEIQVPFCTVWYSSKFHGPGIRYEIAICILTGDIVWINGPFPCGITDNIIYKSDLGKRLCPGEFVEADSGYEGNDNVKPPGAKVNHVQGIKKSQARGRHEGVNGRIKFFHAICDRFRHNDHGKHRTMFVATAVAIQIGFNLNEGLPFKVDDVGVYDSFPAPTL